ncbi:MAG: calcium/sodium antiporter [Acidimicrobiales bacterium]|nr:calcium/sodium antiporter [Acidimicrobiales bacterium]RZV41922.1 MAG: calcium/sodium antiporter [Acidimicrobiales bacterium]
MDALSEPTLLVACIELAIGLALLTKAADLFVDGAVAAAAAAKVSPVVVGAVIVGFGTSAPELLVSGIAASNGDVDLGVGNIVGSNVANLSLVLAAAALVIPVLVTRSVLAREAPLSLMAVALFAFFTIDGFAVWEGIVMFLVLFAVLAWVVLGGHQDSRQMLETDEEVGLGRSMGVTSVGLLGTLFGAQLTVWGAIGIAERYGLSGGFIGFTLVALGTSLPELVTAVAAARKGETELILGNLLGSNIFNSLAVGGLVALLGAGAIDDELMRSYGVVLMLLVAVLAWVFMVVRRRVSKPEATILLTAYAMAILLLSDLDVADSLRSGIESLS